MIEFKLPELGENIEQGDLVRLMIKPGAPIKEGESVMELETDKAVLEVPSSVSGIVHEIRVREGDKIKVGQVVFTVDNGTAAKPAAAVSAQAKPAAPASSSSASAAATRAAQPEPAPSAAAPSRAPVAPGAPSFGNPPASDRRAPAPKPGASEFILPELGENISQGDLVRLMIAPGTKVSDGQPVMELET
ncbi:MAG TPA: biotin/lipoyl-containing protein, partial [Candidatus Sulfotelmatobacter sp.]